MKFISIEVGNEKVIFKMRSSFTTTIFESFRAIKSEIHIGDDDLIDSESYEFDQLLGIDPDIFAYDASCDPYNDICDGGGLPNNIEKLYWESTNDNERVDLGWEELSFNNWVRIKFGRLCKMTKDRILKDYWREIFNETKMKGEEKEDPEEFRKNKTNTMLEIILDKINET
uniref:Uncharacterized protein n=1 Tax=Tanacetum cinerariifolium TaxID=118510 RepID=A0A699RPL0_TANCI|nr:hypothetical protein [Tanacetum cinerariifolium]